MVRTLLVSLRRLGDSRNSQWQPSAVSTTPYGEEKLSMWIIKKEDLALDSWDTYERNEFSQPGCLHLPTHRGALNSLVWDSWSSLTNSNFWCSDYLPPLLQTSTYPDSFPSLLRAVSQGYLRGYLPGLKSYTFLPNKTTLRLWLLFYGNNPKMFNLNSLISSGTYFPSNCLVSSLLINLLVHSYELYKYVSKMFPALRIYGI